MTRNSALVCHNRWTCSLFAWLTLTGLLVGVVWVAAGQTPHKKSVIKQGICGTVILKRGNQMPSSEGVRTGGQPVEREVLIFPLLNNGQVEPGDNGFINSTGTIKPIKTLKSAKDGTFCVSLPVGRYSVLVREPGGLYANLFDGQGNINPVNVTKNRLSQNRLEITHQAAF